MKEIIYLAAGCFWGVQYYFDQVPGVIETEAGYMNGHTQNPTYEEVCNHTTGHAEAVKVVFDPEEVDLKTLLMQFFYMHDPAEVNRQGPDVGDQYRSAIFYVDESQKQIAETVKQAEQPKFKKPIATEITKAGTFYVAEDYHQKFAERTGRGICHKPYKAIN